MIRIGKIFILLGLLLCAGVSFAAEQALLRLLPITVPTGTRLGGLYLSANSAAGSVALLFLCAVFMAETARQGKAGAAKGDL